MLFENSRLLQLQSFHICKQTVHKKKKHNHGSMIINDVLSPQSITMYLSKKKNHTFIHELIRIACRLKRQKKIRHGLMLLWFTDLMNVTEEVTIHRLNVSTLLSSAFIRGDLNAATRGPFI